MFAPIFTNSYADIYLPDITLGLHFLMFITTYCMFIGSSPLFIDVPPLRLVASGCVDAIAERRMNAGQAQFDLSDMHRSFHTPIDTYRPWQIFTDSYRQLHRYVQIFADICRYLQTFTDTHRYSQAFPDISR